MNHRPARPRPIPAPGLTLVLLALLLGCRSPLPNPVAPPAGIAGLVFEDRDGDGRWQPGEIRIPGVLVSNGREVVKTDAEGRYALPAPDEAVFFVVQPPDHRVPTGPDGRPRFFRIHKPAGSPPGLHFAGVPPTGPLPSRVDFPLLPNHAGDDFSALIFGDTQVRFTADLDALARDVVAPLGAHLGPKVAFGITLGDLVFDELELFEPLSGVLGTLGLPWWSVIGNHDLNLRATDDATSDETWERVYGPVNYAFQVGRVHFVALDAQRYRGWDAEKSRPGGYERAFDESALTFLAAYLDHVPRSDLVVLLTHIPFDIPEGHRTRNLERVLALLSDRPPGHTLSFSGHAHRQFQLFLGAEHGFAGPGAHHHVNVGAVSGSFWLGDDDETGIPHATMRDGTPNGYWIAHFRGTRYHLEFRAARRPDAYQIEVIAPFAVGHGESERVELLANVFAGSERTEVAMQVGNGAWHELNRVLRRDPRYEQAVRREAASPPDDRRPLPGPADSTHLWSARLPSGLPPGTHRIRIRARDPFAGELWGQHVVQVSSQPRPR